MAEDTVITDIDPLQPGYIPETIIDRDSVISELAEFNPGHGRNLLLHGPRGTGKTTLAQFFLQQLEDTTTCYTPGHRYSTQYQALKHIYQVLTREEIDDGHHTAELQRRLEDRTGHSNLVLVFDELDFLLHNDGEDLLYFLSRLDHQENLSLILISAGTESLEDKLEERTYSSLNPHRIPFEPYTAETLFQLLEHRAEHAFDPQSLHRDAVSYIVATTQNAGFALSWLKTAAESTTDYISEQVVQTTERKAIQRYHNQLLDPFNRHHHRLLAAIRDLTDLHTTDTITSGDIYTQYQERCNGDSIEPLSTRRISTYLKHLELLDIIHADYHYGGSTGKTREISLTLP